MSARSALRRAACLALPAAALFLVAALAWGQAVDPSRIEAEMKRLGELSEKWVEAGGDPNEIAPLAQQLQESLQARDLTTADSTLKKLLAIVGRPPAAAAGAGPFRPRVKVKVYDAAGRPSPSRELVPKGYDTVVTGVYALDTDYEPTAAPVQSPEDGVALLGDPLPIPLVLHFFPRVPGFGQIKVFADHDGKGYSPPASGVWEIDLPLEGARSRIHKAQELLDASPGVPFRDETRVRLAEARRHLEAATRDGSVDPSEVYASLRDGLWAGEMATLDAARDAIAKRGRRSDFRFGIFTEGHEQWGSAQKKEVRGLFNSVTSLDFFIRSYEDDRGEPRPRAADSSATLAEQLGVELKGHPLIYFIPPNLPPRLRGKAFDAVAQAMRTRVARDVARFKGRVKVWDVINEPNFSNSPFNEQQVTELARGAMDLVRENDPAAVRVVNVNWPSGEYVAVPALRRIATASADGRVKTTRQFVRSMMAAGVDFEVIGIEMYYPGLDMLELSRLLDRWAKLGKPIHITEIAVASAPGVDRKSQHFQNPDFIAALGEWHEPWSERVQADWAEQLYTLAYAKPSIHALVWTHLVDSFWPYGGLLDRDLEAKESYRRLEKLLGSWGFAGAATPAHTGSK